jgi:hypothetical protein
MQVRADNCIDGNYYTACVSAGAPADSNPSLSINIGASAGNTEIGHVVVVNRLSETRAANIAAIESIYGFKIEVFNSANVLVQATQTFDNVAPSYTFEFGRGCTAPPLMPVPVARYISISHPTADSSTAQLNLAEVSVLWSCESPKGVFTN